MGATVCRRFQIVDGMILVAAFALMASLLREPWSVSHSYGTGTPWITIAAEHVRRWVPPVLVPLSLAAGVIRLLSPRPPRPDLFRQPGAIASTLLIVSILHPGLMALARLSIKGRGGFFKTPRPMMEMETLLALPSFLGAPMIAGAWLGLGLSRSLQFEAGWIDRFGIAVGSAWILYWIAQNTAYWLM